MVQYTITYREKKTTITFLRQRFYAFAEDSRFSYYFVLCIIYNERRNPETYREERGIAKLSDTFYHRENNKIINI